MVEDDHERESDDIGDDAGEVDRSNGDVVGDAGGNGKVGAGGNGEVGAGGPDGGDGGGTDESDSNATNPPDSSEFAVGSARSIGHADVTENVTRWVLFDVPRWWLSMSLVAVVFVVSLAAALGGLLPVTNADLVSNVLSRFVSGTIPFVTIVAAVNQIVLSMDLGQIGELREQLDGMRAFREDVEASTGTATVPATPTGFLRHVTDAIARTADNLVVDDADPGSALESVSDVASVLQTEAHTLNHDLEESDVETFREGSVVLDYDPGRHLFVLQRLQAFHGDELPADAVEAIDDLETLVAHADVARQYFKTLHTKYELSSLSGAVMVAGLPAIILGGLASLAYAQLVALGLSTTALAVVLSLTLTVVFLPYLVLVAYMLQVVAIARKTADFGPFISTSRSE